MFLKNILILINIYINILDVINMNKEQASLIFKALSDPNRLKIVKILLNNNDEVCACKLLKIVNCKQATLSHHLATLKEAEILNNRREGKNIIYHVNRKLLVELNDFMNDTCEECKKIEQ